ncbi:MAG: hypothetical protein ACM3S4_11280 [Burkholderiales bacterium]
MGKKVLAAAVAVLGLACVLLGIFVFTGEEQKSISGLCIGAGAAAGALGLGNLVLLIAVPEAVREERLRMQQIEVNDERNIRIREKAGAMANRVVFYALCAALLVLGMLGDLLAVFILVGILVLEAVLVIILTNRYSKQM